MPPEIGHLNKEPVAVVAAVGLFTRVQSHVSFQVMVPCKPLVADFAHERFFARVSSLVILQHVLVTEASIASFARKRFLAPILRSI